MAKRSTACCCNEADPCTIGGISRCECLVAPKDFALVKVATNTTWFYQEKQTSGTGSGVVFTRTYGPVVVSGTINMYCSFKPTTIQNEFSCESSLPNDDRKCLSSGYLSLDTELAPLTELPSGGGLIKNCASSSAVEVDLLGEGFINSNVTVNGTGSVTDTASSSDCQATIITRYDGTHPIQVYDSSPSGRQNNPWEQEVSSTCQEVFRMSNVLVTDGSEGGGSTTLGNIGRPFCEGSSPTFRCVCVPPGCYLAAKMNGVAILWSASCTKDSGAACNNNTGYEELTFGHLSPAPAENNLANYTPNSINYGFGHDVPNPYTGGFGICIVMNSSSLGTGGVYDVLGGTPGNDNPYSCCSGFGCGTNDFQCHWFNNGPCQGWQSNLGPTPVSHNFTKTDSDGDFRSTAVSRSTYVESIEWLDREDTPYSNYPDLY